jgi:hypothetical protein
MSDEWVAISVAGSFSFLVGNVKEESRLLSLAASVVPQAKKGKSMLR